MIRVPDSGVKHVCPGAMSINNVYKMKAVELLVAMRSRNKKLHPITQLGILTYST